MNFLQCFNKAVSEHCEQCAIVDRNGGRETTYGTLDLLARRVAAKIQTQGIPVHSSILVSMDRCMEYIAAYFGIMKAGCVVVPVVPDYPEERIQYIKQDSNAPMVITLDFFENIEIYEPADDTACSADDPALIIYTSGSTGNPKGIVHTHRSYLDAAIRTAAIYKEEPHLHYGAAGTLSFALFAVEYTANLMLGNTVHILDDETRKDVGRLEKYYQKHHLSAGTINPQMLRVFRNRSSELRLVVAAGERLCNVWSENFKVCNVYGMSEFGSFATYFIVDRKYANTPIGKPCPGTEAFLLDDNGAEVAQGQEGELCMKGFFAQEYLNLPEQTKKIMIPCEDGRVLIHTGDICKQLPDGNYVYVNRKDWMVKINGQRVEIGEIETTILSMPQVKQAAVKAFEDENGQTYLAAYVCAEGLDRDSIRTLAKEKILSKMPQYMVPRFFVRMDELPVNTNGKVDRKALPAPQAEDYKTEYVEPVTVVEKQICDLFEEILHCGRVGTTDDFYAMGGNSLTAMTLSLRLSEMLDRTVPVSVIMAAPTVQGILNSLPDEKTSAETVISDLCPLSDAQFGVYTECMKNPGSLQYNIPKCFEFSADMDPQRLADAVQIIVEAHPYLFTKFVIATESVMQQRSSAEGFKVRITKLKDSELPAYQEDFIKPFSILNTRLFRAEIVCTEERVCLLVDFHHIIFDGMSMKLFQEQLMDVIAEGRASGEKKDYFSYVLDCGKEDTDAWFDKMLSACECADVIPQDLSGGGDEESSAMLSLPLDMTHVQEFCRAEAITPAQLFLAGTAYVVARFTNSHHAFINTISTGRADPALQNSFGMFVKTLPIGMEMEDGSIREWIGQAKEKLIGTVLNQNCSYAKICGKYNYSPDILYAYQLDVVGDIKKPNEQLLRSYSPGTRFAKFKTGIYIEESNGIPSIVITYHKDSYSSGLMQTLAECIRDTVENMMDNPQQRIRKLSMLRGVRSEQTEEFSCTAQKEVPVKLLHEMFEKQVGEKPDEIALVACDGTFTYSQLNERANTVANALRSRNIGAGDRVVLMTERNSGFFAGAFGILKAGAAFIPTDHDYPRERISSIIEDSGAKLIITFGSHLAEYPNTVTIEELMTCPVHEKPDVAISPDNLAYMIYTSGTTGKPKGVMIRHLGIANYLTAEEENLHIHYFKEHCSCIASITSVAFDMSHKETFNALCNGVRLVFASEDQLMDPGILAELFAKNGVDTFNATPSRMLAFMESPEFSKALDHCKLVMCGGEKYPHNLLTKLQAKNVTIMNTYGPTEITVSSNGKNLTRSDHVTIGKPLLNYIEYVVDQDDNKLPANVLGELLIGGIGVGLGYNNLPEQTAKAFVAYEGNRFYRSGDYAKWTEDGEIIILGRKDSQVKLRGLRIELGEVEHVLTEVEGVQSGIVLITRIGSDDGLCAYFTAATNLNPEFVRAEMQKKLTDYMVPTAFVQLESFPLTANGKINTKALPEPVIKEEIREYEEPATSAEADFCNIFAEILQKERISPNDDFFRLGGSSLLVTRILILASKKGYSIAYGDVFKNPTPRLLAKVKVTDTADKMNPFGSISDYDYSDIEKVLSENNMRTFKTGLMNPVGDVILSGATGFLGIHILHELLEQYHGCVTCFIRGKHDLPAEKVLSMLYNYYFGQDIYKTFPGRVKVVEGSLTDAQSFRKLGDASAELFINCAANVKHFSKGTDIEDVNYYGLRNILQYCRQRSLRLVHVSTMSVGGSYINTMGQTDVLKEDMLYIGQTLTSKYTNSKYLAEREILQAVSEGFKAKIMRVGNLSPRDEDGEYQINFESNSAMGRLRIAYMLGHHSYDALDKRMEFSPIDYCAKAIVLLSQTPDGCVVFHPFNNHYQLMEDIYAAMNRVGLSTSPVEKEIYEEILKQAQNDPEQAQRLSSSIAYDNSAHILKEFIVGKSNDFTTQVLHRLGFYWPACSIDYMQKFLIQLRDLDYFEI